MPRGSAHRGIMNKTGTVTNNNNTCANNRLLLFFAGVVHPFILSARRDFLVDRRLRPADGHFLRVDEEVEGDGDVCEAVAEIIGMTIIIMKL